MVLAQYVESCAKVVYDVTALSGFYTVVVILEKCRLMLR
jgi:hypothetical protein